MSEHHNVNYKKIYFTLIALLAVSVAGPLLGIGWLTLVTAFGIAFVKANLVIQNFMHLRWEKKIAKYVLTASLILLALMFAGFAPDVMNHEGNNWVNLAAEAAVERGIDGGHVEEVEEVEVVEAGFNAVSMFGIVCATCHGAEGDGTGAAGLALDPRPANFTDPEFWEERDEARIFQVIRDGAVSVGGSTLMLAWRLSFDDEEIQALADYVMTFRPNE